MSVHASRPLQICTTILVWLWLQPVAIAELVCVLLTLLTMSNVALGLSLESGHSASLARLPGITYLRTCNTVLTLMYSRKGLRHFCSKVHSSQIGFVLVFISRSYCYTVWSAIGIILLSVCPSVGPSVCDAMHCGSQGRCRGLKVVPTWS